MNVPLPEIEVGQQKRHDALSVFPLFTAANSGLKYHLADKALADETATVTETSNAGTVPELEVRNLGDVSILFLEGEELVGAKQNRVLNATVLVPANATIKIPVSCVEQGRWDRVSHYFRFSGSHSSSKLRRILRESVSRSAQAGEGHRSDQAKVWEEVAEQQFAHGVHSPTAAMSDVFAKHQNRVAEFHNHLPYVENAAGVAFSIGSNVVMLDLFDKPSTCERVWDRLLSGLVFDALEAERGQETTEREDVVRVIAESKSQTPRHTAAVGAGEEYRSESADGSLFSALVMDGVVIHGSIIAGQRK